MGAPKAELLLETSGKLRSRNSRIKGKTLEEIDANFEGVKHSSVPDVDTVCLSKATVDVGAIEQELNRGEKGVVKAE
jgi:hypothetical protein